MEKELLIWDSLTLRLNVTNLLVDWYNNDLHDINDGSKWTFRGEFFNETWLQAQYRWVLLHIASMFQEFGYIGNFARSGLVFIWSWKITISSAFLSPDGPCPIFITYWFYVPDANATREDSLLLISTWIFQQKQPKVTSRKHDFLHLIILLFYCPISFYS
jgi:hypothetical protein